VVQAVRVFRRANPLQLPLPFDGADYEAGGWDGADPRALAAAAVKTSLRGSPKGERRGRWNCQSAEEMAAYVRQAYSDRLDGLFERPAGFLRDVLAGVSAAEKMLVAIDTGDRDACEEAAAALRAVGERLARAGMGLGPHDLLYALQLGLFPELHCEDAATELAVRAAAEHACRRKAAREAELLAKLGRDKRLTAAERAELNDMRREVDFPAPPPVCPCCRRRTPLDARGLVPAGGGERVGAARVAALAGALGAG
jgi:hypothetical protein